MPIVIEFAAYLDMVTGAWERVLLLETVYGLPVGLATEDVDFAEHKLFEEHLSVVDRVGSDTTSILQSHTSMGLWGRPFRGYYSGIMESVHRWVCGPDRQGRQVILYPRGWTGDWGGWAH